MTVEHDTDLHLGAAANVIMADGTILASEAVTKQAGETFDEDDVANVIKHVLEMFAEEEGRPPQHVVIHRDGKFYLDVESLINRLDKARDLIQRFDLVEIRNPGIPASPNTTNRNHGSISRTKVSPSTSTTATTPT
ncbi:hypothetical protein [Haloplanus salilacus]|uniref:hypothetical protein n=1 Tax=Haloplanus salilacus TaxID=2949994 RepID=UPI0030D4C3E1